MTTEAKPETNAVAKRPDTVKGYLAAPSTMEQIRKVLPTHLKPDRMLRVATTALLKTPKLAQCSVESFARAMLDCSALGLEPDGRLAHLIPYGSDATLIVDYKGLAALAMRSGMVSSIHADVVCENDKFMYDCGEVKSHVIDFKKPRGQMYAAYAICHFKDGAKASAVMSKDEIDGIRNRSRAGKAGPWVTDYNEMAKKTAFRRLAKWLPLSPEFRDALDKDADALADDMPRAEVIDVSKAGSVLAKKADMPPPPADDDEPPVGSVEQDQTPTVEIPPPGVQPDMTRKEAENIIAAAPRGVLKRAVEKYDLTPDNWRQAADDLLAIIANDIKAGV